MTGLHRNAWIVCRDDGLNLVSLNSKRPGDRLVILQFTMDPESMAAMAGKVAAFFRGE